MLNFWECVITWKFNRLMYPIAEQNCVLHNKGRCISTTSPVGWAHGMILAFHVSLQWALVTYLLSLDPCLLVGKCVRLLLDVSIMWITTIAQHSSQILDFLDLSSPTSWSEFSSLICLYHKESLVCVKKLIISDVTHFNL